MVSCPKTPLNLSSSSLMERLRESCWSGGIGSNARVSHQNDSLLLGPRHLIVPSAMGSSLQASSATRA